MSWPKVALILGLCSIVTAAWISRWSEPVFQGDGKTAVIDRWTGDVWFVFSNGGLVKARTTIDFTKEMGKK